MNFGMTVFDANGVQTLGVEDFTVQKMAQMILPATRKGGAGVRSDYILMDVPGYNPATCFVVITPRVYAGYNQPGYPDLWGYVPTYKELGGSQIGIFTYVNRRRPTGYHDNYVDEWTEHTVECVVEVVKVL